MSAPRHFPAVADRDGNLKFMADKYTIELFREGGEGNGLERVLGSDDDLTTARRFYKLLVDEYPGRLVMLCDRARILARSDRSETMPE